MPGPKDLPTIMLLTLLHSIALLGAASHTAPSIAPQVPSKPLERPEAIRIADVPTEIQITATHFVARSLVNESQWLIFMNQERSFVRVRGLRPFESALLPIPTGSTEGMSIELVARSVEGQLLSSGAIQCTSVASAKGGVFMERTKSALIGWTPRHGGRSLTRLAAQPSTIAATLSPRAASTAQPAAPHVPIPVPAENRTKDKSRKLNKKKLPPI